jgi:GH25 family lysozyme M1 (1,4-beta-N-acetylmuramidase)
MSMILGVDLYDGNVVDYQALARRGVRFGWVKISEGGDLQHRARAHVQGLKSIGAEVGGYTYVYAPRENQLEAAQVFCDELLAVGAIDLSPVVDIENMCSASAQICVDPRVALEHAEIITAEIRRILGVDPIVYTGTGFWSKLGAAGQRSWLRDLHLWLADYHAPISGEWTPPTKPPFPCPPWTDDRIVAKQFSDGAAHGFAKLDKNYTTEADLARCRWGTKAKPYVPPITAQEILMSPLDPWAK